jgi:A/G-specific adenine glycosylase
MSFPEKILTWYSLNKRDLPWRATRDPYKIWLSEIMLQQTRVAQGMPYYEKFLEHYPTVHDLADAGEGEVLKLWQGLGYYSRARNLHATAKWVSRELGGKFPEDHAGLLCLKGVGDYTASAIASICYGEASPVVDGNVYRVLARSFGVEVAINGPEGPGYFKQLAREVMDRGNSGAYNQGIMEFGALQCTPQKPNCAQCPLNDGCAALKENKVSLLPVKIKRNKVRNRYFNYLVVLDGEQRTRIRQRKGRGIWENLFEFPLLESEREYSLADVDGEWGGVLEAMEDPELYQFNQKQIVHKLSHQHLHTKFWIVRTPGKIKDGVAFSELKHYPVPVLIADFINTFKI